MNFLNKQVKELIERALKYRNLIRYFDWRYLSIRLTHIRFYRAKKDLLFTYSIVIPTFNSNEKLLRKAIRSVWRALEFYKNLNSVELILSDDNSNQFDLQRFSFEVQREFKNLKFIFVQNELNLGIALNSNSAIERANHEYVILLDHDDEISHLSFLELEKAILEEKPDFIYSDEDKIKSIFKLNPHFKPDYSPETLLSHNYICHLVCFKKDLYFRSGGFGKGVDGAQDFDLFLRMTSLAKKVYHIPKVLYHWRMIKGSTSSNFNSKNFAWESGRTALINFLEGDLSVIDVSLGELPGTYRVRRKVEDIPVYVIIPFRDKVDFTQKAIDSLLKDSLGLNLNLILLNNQSKEIQTEIKMDEWKRAGYLVLNFDEEFNFSKINNFAVNQIRVSDCYLVFMNNDIELIGNENIRSLLENLSNPNVAFVGGKLYYPNLRIQHAGVVVGLNGIADHSFKFSFETDIGNNWRTRIIQNVSSISGALLATRMEVFKKLNGFDENLPIAYNDIDLCLRALELGYRNLYTPYCKGIHHESISRGYEITKEKKFRLLKESEYMFRKHQRILRAGDPYYNVNFSLKGKSHRYEKKKVGEKQLTG